MEGLVSRRRKVFLSSRVLSCEREAVSSETSAGGGGREGGGSVSCLRKALLSSHRGCCLVGERLSGGGLSGVGGRGPMEGKERGEQEREKAKERKRCSSFNVPLKLLGGTWVLRRGDWLDLHPQNLRMWRCGERRQFCVWVSNVRYGTVRNYFDEVKVLIGQLHIRTVRTYEYVLPYVLVARTVRGLATEVFGIPPNSDETTPKPSHPTPHH